MTTSAKNAYSGDLATPIELTDIQLSPFDSQDERSAKLEALATEGRRITAERMRRIFLLMAHYKVPADRGLESMALLAIELASAHVPGLRVEAPKLNHRPREWTALRNARLVADMAELIAAGKTKAAAARSLVKRDEYAPPDVDDERRAGLAKSLVKRFDEAKADPFVSALYEIAKDLPVEAFITAVRDMPEKG